MSRKIVTFCAEVKYLYVFFIFAFSFALNFAVANLVESLDNIGSRLLVEHAHDVNCNQRKDKARNNFVKPKEFKLFPSQNRNSADYYARDNAASRGAPPK